MKRHEWKSNHTRNGIHVLCKTCGLYSTEAPIFCSGKQERVPINDSKISNSIPKIDDYLDPIMDVIADEILPAIVDKTNASLIEMHVFPEIKKRIKRHVTSALIDLGCTTKEAKHDHVSKI